jgi:hypothetical protein
MWALFLLLAAIPGMFIFLLWDKGFLSENVSAVLGIEASAVGWSSISPQHNHCDLSRQGVNRVGGSAICGTKPASMLFYNECDEFSSRQLLQ